MPDPIQTANMFIGMQPDKNAERANMLSDIQTLEGLKQIKQRNMLGEVLKETGGDYDAASKALLARGGDPNAAFKLRDRATAQADRERTIRLADEDRARSNQLRDIEAAGLYQSLIDKAPTVNAQNWSAWRSQLAKVAKLAGTSDAEIPTEYDPAFVAEAQQRLLAASRPQVENIGGREFVRQGTSYDPKPLTPVEQWRTLSADDERKQGLDPSGTYRMSSTGKVEPVVRPPTATQPAQSALMDDLVASGVAPNRKAAWDMVRTSMNNPQKMAVDVASTQFEAQTEAIANGYMKPEEAKPFEQYLMETQDMLAKHFGGSAGEGTIDSPAQPTTQEAYDALPSGAYFIDPQDGGLYQKP